MTQVWWQADCLAVNEKVKTEAQERQQVLTKPPGSLGRLENVAITLASLYCDDRPMVKKPMITIFAGDHGVVAQGVSAFPQAVTVEMIRNFVKGGAAISALARFNDAQLKVVDCGTAFEIDFADEFDDLISKPIAAGTADLSLESAMTSEQLAQALCIGQQIAEQCKKDGIDLFIAGEMGIGNTTAAAAVACAAFGGEASDWVGRGTGINDESLELKQKVVEEGCRLHKERHSSSFDILRTVGGRELAAIAGALIEARYKNIPVILDGFISTASAAVTLFDNTAALDHAIISHISVEQGHQKLIEMLGKKPLLDLGLRLGEASGAAVALMIVKAAIATHNGMATFGEAGVSVNE